MNKHARTSPQVSIIIAMSTSQPGALTAAILIVSETAYKDPSTDKAGDVLREVFESEGGGKWPADGITTKIVPDDQSQITGAIASWTDGDDFKNLVITTGGTGFTPKDVTPEAVTPLLHRHAPGLVHGMLAASFQVTPFAMMSRPVAGVRKSTIIVTLPGSPKGAKENLQAIIKLLPHACLQAAGENSRTAHAGGTAKLEKDAGINGSQSGAAVMPHTHNHKHHHTHHHDHGAGHKVPKAHTNPSERPQSNDPLRGAANRARQSPYPMLSVSEAINTILTNTPGATASTISFSPNLVGSIISSDIRAKEAVPAYRASIVDGYAVIVPPSPADRTSLKSTFPVASISHAQASSTPPPLQQGQIARITTGAPLPENANAVVMVEDTVVASLHTVTDPLTGKDIQEEKEVQILTDELEVGENVREPGSDIAKGSVVLHAGQRIMPTGGEIGVLAASGTREVPVYRRPRVGVLSTGDEVTDISHAGPLTGGMIRDSNRPSLLSLISSWQLCEEVVDLGIARDTPAGELETALRDAYRMHDLDVVVTTGGVSMGELDLLKPTIERVMGGTIHFGRVNMKPGKPTTFASVPVKLPSRSADAGPRQDRLIFALPGNPASALVTANLFLLPSLQKLTGVPDPKGLEKVMVRLAGRVRCDKARPEYHRCTVSFDQQIGGLVAISTGMQRSSRVGSVGRANGLLCLPAKEGGLEGGEQVECLLMGPITGV